MSDLVPGRFFYPRMSHLSVWIFASQCLHDSGVKCVRPGSKFTILVCVVLFPLGVIIYICKQPV